MSSEPKVVFKFPLKHSYIGCFASSKYCRAVGIVAAVGSATPAAALTACHLDKKLVNGKGLHTLEGMGQGYVRVRVRV